MMPSRAQKVIGYVTETWISDETVADLGADFVNAHLLRCFWDECRAENLTLSGEPEIFEVDPARIRSRNFEYHPDEDWRADGAAYRVAGRVVKHIGRPFKH